MGIVDVDKAVPLKKRGPKKGWNRPIATDDAPAPVEIVHPVTCGCWQCEGYTTYEEYVEANSGDPTP